MFVNSLWRIGKEYGQGTTSDYSSPAGRAYHNTIIGSQVSVTPLMKKVVQCNENREKLEGQQVLKVSTYTILLETTGTRHGPPCFFGYPSIKDCEVMRFSLFNFLWLNDIACTKGEDYDAAYAILQCAPYLPMGRLLFVITIGTNKPNFMAVSEQDRELVGCVVGYSTLLLDQKYCNSGSSIPKVFPY